MTCFLLFITWKKKETSIMMLQEIYKDLNAREASVLFYIIFTITFMLNSFFYPLVYNNMTLKSGTIGGAKSFAGYFTTLSGKTVILAMLVNNYEGSANAIVGKIFTLLDELKK